MAEALAAELDLSKAVSEKAVNALIEMIVNAVASGDEVQLPGFGKFASGTRAAREGRNPSTGEKLKIAASRTVKFSAGKTFKDTVNATKLKKASKEAAAKPKKKK